MVMIRDCRYGPMMFFENDIVKGKELLLYGEAGFHEIEYYRQLIRPGDVVVDVGAHIGTLAIPFGLMVGSEGKVIAIEAYSFPSYVLSGNVALNNLHNIRVIHAAASDTSAVVLFEKVEEFARNTNFGALKLSPEPTDKPVPSLAIDDLNLGRLDFLKVDVEGMECAVLEGARQTITRCRPWLVVEFLENLRAIVDFLKSLDGYDCKVFQPPLFNENNFARNQENIFPNIASFDLVCYPVERQPPPSEWFVGVPKSS